MVAAPLASSAAAACDPPSAIDRFVTNAALRWRRIPDGAAEAPHGRTTLKSTAELYSQLSYDVLGWLQPELQPDVARPGDPSAGRRQSSDVKSDGRVGPVPPVRSVRHNCTVSLPRIFGVKLPRARLRDRASR